jgi:hypothetical protein
MNNDNDKNPKFRYEDGNGNKLNPEFAVFTVDGKDYKVPMLVIREMAKIEGMPLGVRERIYHWAKMMHNPD